jgi:hypothetical protein
MDQEKEQVHNQVQEQGTTEGELNSSLCETYCPPCPVDSFRNGKTFTYQIENLPTICNVSFFDAKYDVVQCNNGVVSIPGSCEQPVEITVCENTPSEQTLTCCLTLDYLQFQGDIELLFNIFGTCDSDCLLEPTETVFHAVAKVTIDELCFYCEGTRPNITNEDLCKYFSIVVDSVSPTGLITYTVTFIDCPAPV